MKKIWKFLELRCKKYGISTSYYHLEIQLHYKSGFGKKKLIE